MKTVLSISIVLLAGTVWAGSYNGGSGTEAKPYKISSAGNWQELMNTSSDWDKHFVLTQNLFFLMGADLVPVGNNNKQFSGVVDGQGYSFIGANIEQPESDYVGLFGYIGDGGQIKNLGVNIKVNGKTYVGGLAGFNQGTLTDCFATGSVNGTGTRVGGLVGYNYDGILTDCYATSSVAGTVDVGGLVGLNGGSLISCYATGSVSGTEKIVGGLVGFNSHALLTTCYATGSVISAGMYTGGLIGINSKGTLSACYATGSVNGTMVAGGLVGNNDEGAITECYSIGSVSGTVNIGGLVGFNNDSLVSCFWDIQTSTLTDGVGNEDPDPSGVMGKTTAQMKSLSTFTPAEWDFIHVWGIIPNQTYPYLRTELIADLNHDRKIDLADFEIFASQWLRQ